MNEKSLVLLIIQGSAIIIKRRHDTQHNDTQHNFSQHNGLIFDTEHERHSAWATSIVMLSVDFFDTLSVFMPIINMLSVVMPSAIMLNDYTSNNIMSSVVMPSFVASIRM
jgi:hypothetical protein